MAKKRRFGRVRYKRRAGRRSRTFPLALAPALIVPGASILGGGKGHSGLIKAFQTGNLDHIAVEIKNIVPYEILGYRWDGTWDFGIIARNIGLVGGGVLVHSAASALGVNKYMRRVPVVGRYLSI